MTLYVLYGEDATDGLERRITTRVAHLARLGQLRDEGRLVMGGGMPAIDAEDPGPAGFFGSLIVADFPSLEEAEAWFAVDPYVSAGVFARTAVWPFKEDFPR